VFHSPLGRAAKTAEIVADSLSLPTVEVADLAEVHHGDMAGLSDAQIDTRFPGAFNERERNKYIWAFPNGESYADAELRATAALNTIADTGTRRPLIVSHEMIGRMLLKQLLGLEPRTALAERQPNNVVNVVSPRSAVRTTIVA
jgi:broad specificity phosphatase PhoE